jgi:hypothetical protein
MKFFRITIYLLLLFIASISFIITTSFGTKLLLTFVVPYKINVKQISGSLYQGLYLEDLNITNNNFNLKITKASIKINWLELFKKQKIAISIREFNGFLNNNIIKADINFFIKKKINYLLIINNNFKNFIKIGNNILNLEQDLNNNIINFKLIINNLEQLDFFNQKISGKLIANGSIANDFSKIVANFTELPIMQHSNNKLTLLINKQFIEASINFQDISYFMKLMPSITRLKGKLIGFVKLDYNKNISTNLALKDLTMSLPEYGIKIKPLNINLSANATKHVLISGKGFMRNGPGEFDLKGFIEPFSNNYTNLLEVSGNNIECINTSEYHLITSLQLKLSYIMANNALTINGKINIPKGTINLDNQKTVLLVKSKDIIFNNHVNIHLDNNLKILPTIDLKIEPETKLLGKGLNTIISGKLKIYTENNILLGDGRITIKQGTYKLSGQEFTIEKGRMIYLPGTLINNPTLDIKIFPKIKQQQEQYLYVEGNLNNPIIKDSGLANEHQAMLQLLGFGSDKITAGIKEKLHLQEFGIQEDNYLSSKFKFKPFDESLLQNKFFVVGKKINKNTNLQYLKTLNSIDNTVRLKYMLSPNWSLGLESSTEGGHGADLEFSLEK